MARELGSLYYKIGIKGAEEFTGAIDKVRQKLLRLPSHTGSGISISFPDPRRLARFGDDVARALRSSSATFRAELQRSITDQVNVMRAAVRQLGPGSRRGRAIQEVLDIRQASRSNRPGSVMAGPAEIMETLKQRGKFEEGLVSHTSKRASAEAVLRGLSRRGTITEDMDFTKYLRTGIAKQVAGEASSDAQVQSLRRMNSEIADAHRNYEASTRSAADLLNLQNQIAISAKTHANELKSISSAENLAAARATDVSHGFAITASGATVSEETAAIGRKAYERAKSSRASGINSAMLGDIDQRLADVNELYDSIQDKVNGVDAATGRNVNNIKAERDELINQREELEEISSLVEEINRQERTRTRANPATTERQRIESLRAGFIASNPDIDPGTIDGAEEIDALVDRALESQGQRRVADLISSSRIGRFISMRDEGAGSARAATEELANNASLTGEQQVSLRAHARAMQEKQRLAQRVIDISTQIDQEERLGQAAQGAGNGRQYQIHADNVRRLTVELQHATSAANAFNAGAHDASQSSGRWNYQMLEIGYGVQDVVQVLAGGGGLSAALRAGSNNFSQFFAAAGGPNAAVLSSVVALGVLGVSIAIDKLGGNSETAAKKMDHLIERLKIAAELNSEYAKSSGIMFRNSVRGGGLDFDRMTSAEVDIENRKKEGSALVGKEMLGKGYGGYSSSESNQTWSELGSQILSNVKWVSGFGSPDNEISNAGYSKGAFDRLFKQRFYEGRSAEVGVTVPERSYEGMTSKEKEIFDILSRTKVVTDENGVSKTEWEVRDIDEAIRIYTEAGGEASDELRQFADQLKLDKDRLDEMIRIQRKSVESYGSRRDFRASDERKLSLFDSVKASELRERYAEDFISAAEGYAGSKSQEMKGLASEQAKSAYSGFKNVSLLGSSEGPASDVSRAFSSVITGDHVALERLNEISKSDDVSEEIKNRAKSMSSDIKKSQSERAFVAARNSAMSYSPTKRIGETEDEFMSRITSEVNEFKQAAEQLGNSVGMPRGKIDELKTTIDALGESAKISAQKNKELKEINIRTGDAMVLGKRRENEYLSKSRDIQAKRLEAIANAQEKYLKSGRSVEDDQLMAAEINAANVSAVEDDVDLARKKEDDSRKIEDQRSRDLIVGAGGADRDKEFLLKLNEIDQKKNDALIEAEREFEDNGDEATRDLRVAAIEAEANTATEKASQERQMSDIEREFDDKVNQLLSSSGFRSEEDLRRKEIESEKKKALRIAAAEGEFALNGDPARRDAARNAASAEHDREMEDISRERDKIKRQKDLQRDIDSLVGGYSTIGEEEYNRKKLEREGEFREKRIAAQQEYEDNGDLDAYNKRIAALSSEQSRLDKNDARRREADMFSSKSRLGSDVASLIGGREEQRYGAQMKHADRLAAIEADDNLTQQQKTEQADQSARLLGFEMEKIDRKNVSFTGVSDIWKTIQGSLKDDYMKKMGKEFHEYMQLAKDRGVAVRLAIGN